MTTLSEEARKYLGQREISGNLGFVDPEFEKEMKEEDWQKTWPWCSCFVQLVVVNCLPDKAVNVRKLISPSVIQTYRNLRDASYVSREIPQRDCIVIYQSYKDGKPKETGHIGIISSVDLNGRRYMDISGNTNETGSREGIMVGEKSHHFENTLVDNGLRRIGIFKVA